MEGQKVWNAIISSIKSQVSASIFKTWFTNTSALDFQKKESGGILIVGLKHNFQKAQFETKYLPIIREAAKNRGFGEIELAFVVTKSEKKVSRNEPLFSGIAPTYVGSFYKHESLTLTHTFENFVVGHSNNLAFLAFEQAAGNLGSLYNPLFVWGPTGVGKTHLLQALGNEVLKKTLDAKVLYASAEKFTNDYVESLRNRTPAAFRHKYRSVDVLLVDDVQFFAGKESTQDEFFNTFNELYLSGRQIVLASDRHPKDLGKLKERLVSRFLGGMTVDIAKPDLELRMAILRAKCMERDVILDEETINYVAEACRGGIRELEGVWAQVLLLTKLKGGKVGIDQIKSAVETNRGTEVRSVSPGKIIEAVARHFKLAGKDLCGPRRKAALVYARQVLMYLLRSELDLPLTNIGQVLGGRDHSTVIYGIEKIERQVLVNQNKRDEIFRIRSSF